MPSESSSPEPHRHVLEWMGDGLYGGPGYSCQGCGWRFVASRAGELVTEGKAVIAKAKPVDSESSSPEGAHVHEWGAWAPDKLQPRNGLEYAWCPCGASKARRAEPEEPEERECSHESWEERLPINGMVSRWCSGCGAYLGRFKPEEGVCVCDHPEGDHGAGLKPPYDGCNWCKDCPGYRTEPDFEIPPSVPRRPPYAVAYAVEGGALYEVALSGDATVVAEDGVLQIIHPSKAVLGITRVTPMTIEERGADDGAQ